MVFWCCNMSETCLYLITCGDHIDRHIQHNTVVFELFFETYNQIPTSLKCASMREVNLISIVDCFKYLSAELFQNYLSYYSVKIKDSEIDDLSKFLIEIKKINQKISNFDMYFVGYVIPQISKEFDLLRFDNDTILNIEIKREGTPQNKKTIRTKQILFKLLEQRNPLFHIYFIREQALYN